MYKPYSWSVFKYLTEDSIEHFLAETKKKLWSISEKYEWVKTDDYARLINNSVKSYKKISVLNA